MRTIAIINLKGGVAKTTSSVNIAYILTTRGYGHDQAVSEQFLHLDQRRRVY